MSEFLLHEIEILSSSAKYAILSFVLEMIRIKMKKNKNPRDAFQFDITDKKTVSAKLLTWTLSTRNHHLPLQMKQHFHCFQFLNYLKGI
jgi:hypothetical protein